MKEIAAYRPRAESRRRLLGLAICLVVYAGLTAGLYRTFESRPAGSPVQVVTGTNPPRRAVTVRDQFFFVDGEPFLIQAVGWDPVRPGELPWRRSFNADEVEADLSRIREAGFNTIRSWAPLREEELALAERHGLRVLQGIWVAPDGRFEDPEFRRQTLARVAQAVETSRWSPAILGYLVWNEPRAGAVARAGLPASLSFLREVVATVRALDPSAPIGISGWPGLEAVDDDLLDFVGVNLYPHRPRVVMNELGLGGYVRLVRDSIARGRPLVVTEFGISVSPGQVEVPGRGGASEAEQAEGLCELMATVLGSGAGGTSVFQWSDGWWKNHDYPGDEQTQDPDDPEEWFGLIRFAGLEDRLGTPRPALAAFSRCQRAVVVEPDHGFVDPGRVPVWIHAREPVTLRLRVSGGAAQPVELERSGRAWYTGAFSLPAGDWRHEVELEITNAAGELVGRERRLLRSGAERSRIEISPARLVAAPGEPLTVEVRLTGASLAAGEEVGVTVATYTEDRFNEDIARIRVAPGEAVEVRFQAPAEETILSLLAFEDDPALPPWERAGAFAAVEVRAP